MYLAVKNIDNLAIFFFKFSNKMLNGRKLASILSHIYVSNLQKKV